MSAGLSDVERGYAFEHFTEDDTHMGRCYLEPDVERIIAARLAEVEAERDSLVRLMLAANSRAEEADTALADLRAAVEALADGIKAGTADFMAGFDRAGDGISTRMNGETAAMVVMVRSEMESHVRALLAQQHDGGAS